MGESMTMTTLLSTIGEFFTAMVGWIGDVVTFIEANPLLLAFVVLAIVSIVIGIVRSWIPGRGV